MLKFCTRWPKQWATSLCIQPPMRQANACTEGPAEASSHSPAEGPGRGSVVICLAINFTTHESTELTSIFSSDPQGRSMIVMFVQPLGFLQSREETLAGIADFWGQRVVWVCKRRRTIFVMPLQFVIVFQVFWITVSSQRIVGYWGRIHLESSAWHSSLIGWVVSCNR